MAAGESAVNRASMAQAAQQVEAAVGVISGLQANMNGYTSQLGGGWQGTASAAFTQAYEMFSADFAKVLNSLQVIQEKLVSTRNTYQATEEANTAKVNQVASMIGGGAALGGTQLKSGFITPGGPEVKDAVNIAGNNTAASNLGFGAGSDGFGLGAAQTAAPTGAAGGLFGGDLRALV